MNATSKPVVPVRGEATVFYNEGAKCFQFNGVIGLGHPRLAEGVLIRSSRIVGFDTTDGRQRIETLNTVYDCDSFSFDKHQPQALELGKSVASKEMVRLA